MVSTTGGTLDYNSKLLRSRQKAGPWALLWALPCFKCNSLLMPQNIWQQPCSASLRKYAKGSPLEGADGSTYLRQSWPNTNACACCVPSCVSILSWLLGKGVAVRSLQAARASHQLYQLLPDDNTFGKEGSREWVTVLMKWSWRSSSSLRYMKWKEWLVK